MPIKNQVQLITYPDSLGGDLATLDALFSKHFAAAFTGGLHILPPFPSSADRGFAPLTYFSVDPAFGTWEDIRKICRKTDVLLDLMVNHISRQSPYFQDFVRWGRKSEFADLFITLDKIWPDGKPSPDDIDRLFLRKPERPFSDVIVAETGLPETVWTSFGTQDLSEQIDLDVHSGATRRLFEQVLAHMGQHGVKIVRLDAIGYVIKRPGTSCFFVEPGIYEFLAWIAGTAHAVGIEVLPEVHGHYSLQVSLADHGYWTYDFVLPMLILHALNTHSSVKLSAHLRSCPRRQFTMLDCHDGIPVQPDLDGILDVEESRSIVQTCLERGANLNRLLSNNRQARAGFDAHQINCTYYSALGQDDDAYMAARAIQFFAPGVPQVYYVGLLAGSNDQGEVARTGEGRAINRRNYSVSDVENELRRPVVQRLMRLIEFRSSYDAFNGNFQVGEPDDSHLELSWQKTASKCVLTVELGTNRALIRYTADDGTLVEYMP